MNCKQKSSKEHETDPTLFFEPRHPIHVEGELQDSLSKEAFSPAADENETEHSRNTASWE